MSDMKHLTSDELRIIYFANNNPKGIRDRSGYLFFFREISKYSGQDERYKEEVYQIHQLADFLLQQLNSERIKNNKLAEKMLSDEKTVVQFYYHGEEDIPATVVGASGFLSPEMLSEIECNVTDEPELYFKYGAGDYLFNANHEVAQTGEYGRVEIDAHWRLDFIRFKAAEQISHAQNNVKNDIDLSPHAKQGRWDAMQKNYQES